ncbi:MAG: beta strand repeat-containing protein, partial [Nostoc sp.]
DTVALSGGGRLLTTTSSNGRAGDITVKTPDLQLTGASSGLFAGTTSTGDAGNLTIQPRDNGQSVRVNLQDGAQISASTFSSGRGGELTIAAPDSITLTGNGSVIAAGTGGSGNAGNLNLRTRNLNIQNQAEVTVSSTGTGSAGSLFVDADRIFLNNQGSIRADTSGGGGNINLRSPLIVLRNGSNITTNATGANIPGGNIGIDTRFLVAVPNEDSNISANSEDFRGGNVRINAFSTFGIQPSLVSTPLSDITATGATSTLNGTTNVNTAGIDPTSGLIALPTDFVDRSGLIAQGCPTNQENSFVISGRGGLPPTPEQQLDDDANWQDRRRLVANQQVNGGGQGDTKTAAILNSQLSIPNSPPLPHTPIIEATGWLITPTGEISLVASTPDPTMQNRLKWSGVCSREESSKQLK